MSNRAELQATKFINHPQGTETVGYRIYDDHGQAYNNCFESLPDDDLEFLQQVLESDLSDQASDIFDFIEENESGLFVNGNWYDWSEIRHLFA